MEPLAAKKFVFVVMPFNKSFDDTYELAIKRACHDAGAYCERVDEQKYQGTVIERICNQIRNADLVVADLSQKNANVAFEAGYAHALGKTIIHLINNVSDIPFDLQVYPHIVYHNLTDLYNKLREHLGDALTKDNSYDLDQKFKLEFFMGDSCIVDTKVVSVSTHNEFRMRNCGTTPIRDVVVSLNTALKLRFHPEVLQSMSVDGQIIYDIFDYPRLIPQRWVGTRFIVDGLNPLIDDPVKRVVDIPAILSVFSLDMWRQISFVIQKTEYLA